MEELIVYLLKSGLITAVFFGIYWLFLKNETFYRFNRHFLLTGMICSLLLPFIKYSYNINVVVQASLNQMPATANPIQQSSGLPLWLSIIVSVYAVVASFFMIRHIAGLMKIKKLVLKYGYTLLQGYKVINTPVLQSSFSVFNYIFIDISADTSETERKLILAHELAHVKQSHWVDLLAAQLLCALQWFNPFAWLYLHAIKQNHEFLADEAVLQQGNSAAIYRAALINHSLKTPVFLFASSFANYDKFKRIKMMTKPNSRPYRKVAVLIAFPALALFLFAFSEPKYILIHANQPNSMTGQLKINQPEAKKENETIKEITVSAKRTSGRLILKTTQRLKTKVALPALLSTSVINIRRVANASNDASGGSLTTTLTLGPNDSKLIIIDHPKPSIKTEEPLLIYNGKVVATISNVKSVDIQTVNVIKGAGAVEKYGPTAKNGVIEIYSKKHMATAEVSGKPE